MLKFKTVTKAIHANDLYKFHTLINEYGDVIFEKLDEVSGDSDTENLYFLLLTELWNEKESVIEHISQFDDYIDFKMDLIKKEAACLTLDTIKSFPSLADENIDLTVLKQRAIVHRNERVLNYILIENFKTELGISNTKFEKVVPIMKRAMENNGIFYTITHSSQFAFFIYISTGEKLYVKSLNIRFEHLIGTVENSEYNLNALTEVEIQENKSLETISREFRLDFTDSKPLVLLEERSIECRDIKNYILDFAKDNAIPIANHEKKYESL
ncbi:MAG: hypothetical protein ACRCWG_13395 [Sarcina sp.]